MRYELMRPGQIQDAIRRNVPLLIPTGVIEYHGHHNPIGVDALITQGIAHLVEKEVECVVAPTFFYGYTGNWAGGIEVGEIHVDGDALFAYVKPIVKAFVDAGWRRVYIIGHHQGPTGVTWLSYQRAATEAVMEYGLEKGGIGWHMDAKLRSDVFGWVRLVSASQFSKEAYGGHGGRDETVAMMYLCPGTVDLEELKKVRPSFALDAHEATRERGEKIAKAMVAGWVEALRKPG
jgi:creatinine amidohydrolase